METNAIIVFVLAFLALPGIASGITGLLKGIAPSVHPKAILYVVSCVLTGIIMLGTGASFPEWSGDPVVYIGLWQAWVTTNSKAAETIYRLLQPKLWPDDGF